MEDVNAMLKDLRSSIEAMMADSDKLLKFATKLAEENERFRAALKRIDEEDDTGPTIFEERGDGPWQAIGGSKGKFSAIARAALRSQS